MFRTARSTLSELSRELETLPSDCLTYGLNDALLVIGPSGVYVIIESDGDLERSARLAVERASSLRARLSDRLAWVPFVDAIVIASRPTVPDDTECVVVPVTMIRDVIANGPRTLDAETLMQLALLGLPRATM